MADLIEFPVLKRLRERIGLRLLVGFPQVRTLTPEQKELAERYKKAIASVLGVPEEAIREDVVEKWVAEWTKAFVKPEYLREHPELLAKLGVS